MSSTSLDFNTGKPSDAKVEETNSAPTQEPKITPEDILSPRNIVSPRQLSSPRDRNCITGTGILNDGDVKFHRVRNGPCEEGNPITGEGYSMIFNTRDRYITKRNTTLKW